MYDVTADRKTSSCHEEMSLAARRRVEQGCGGADDGSR